ncbi:MAG: family 10 glycosylhydrolase [Planctomycetes bacterium]|nr:family 10 glycosylhydrolase [Planctomycetota bacterium]
MKPHTRKTLLNALILATTLAVSTGCQTGPQTTGPMRAIWVTRYDYTTADEVTEIIDNCAEAGFNAVLFQVRGNGTVFYPSKIEPWAEQLDYTDPGFDPLALAVEQAHSRGIELHAWVNVMPAWRGPNEPGIENQLYFTHPEWFWYDPDGNRQPLLHQVGERKRGWYASLNPCLPVVRDYLVEVFAELVGNYDVDGLHLDYIRFPNERVVPGEKMPDYPHDERTLQLYRQDTGLAPGDDAEAWNRWRSAQVTELVAQIHAMMRRTNPDAVLSAAVGSVPARALTHFQDSKTWIQRGIIDTVFLMNYTGDVEKFKSRLTAWEPDLDQTRLVPGLWFDEKLEADQSAAVAMREIEVALEMSGNFCVFAYSSLFDSGNKQVGPRGDQAAQKRALRRETLFPFLRGLASADGPT